VRQLLTLTSRTRVSRSVCSCGARLHCTLMIASWSTIQCTACIGGVCVSCIWAKNEQV